MVDIVLSTVHLGIRMKLTSRSPDRDKKREPTDGGMLTLLRGSEYKRQIISLTGTVSLYDTLTQCHVHVILKQASELI
jgi:hypothetical protein